MGVSYDIKDAKEGKKTWLTCLVVILLVVVFGLVVLICITYAKDLQCNENNKARSRKSDYEISFLMLSDVHLDPFYKFAATSARPGFCRNESMPSKYTAKYGRIGCDSPMKLYSSTLGAMENVATLQREVEFILSTGDTAAHGLTTDRRSIILNLMKNVSKETNSVFPAIPYFPSIGNNDLPGHYVIPSSNDTWYRELLDIWQDGILCAKCKTKHHTTTKDELEGTFLNGGYYKASIADGKMTLIVLNSMYWTWSTWKPDAYFTEIARTQMGWLESQLKLAKQLKKKVLIASHIAPGVDPYSNTGVYKTLWLQNFTDMYIDLVVNNYSDVVAGQFYAHFHKDSFRFMHNEARDPKFQNSSYILLNPSISVIYKNNPGFRIVHMDPELRAITDYEQYYMNIVMATEFDKPVWQLDYKFSTRYPPSGETDKIINGERIKRLSDGLINQTSDAIFNGYISSRQVRYQPDKYSRFIYYCAVRFLSQDDFNKCQKRFKVPGG